MFFSEEYISDADKIEQVYRMLKGQQRSRRVALFIKLLLIGTVAYGYYYLSLPEHANIRKDMTDMAQDRITELVVPMVNDMVKNMTNTMIAPGASSSTGVQRRNIPRENSTQTTSTMPTITPEMIKAVQDSMQKK